MNVNIVYLGNIEYEKALKLQEKMLLLRQQNQIADTLLLLEHQPVLTLGRRGVYSNILLSKDELAEMGISVYEISRGGDVTYHGPGQIVGYPIMDLNNYGRNIKEFVWNIEEVFIKLLREEYDILAGREENKYTGVWVGNRKITAIGIAVKHWVTMHGFAFNVNTQLEHFKWIVPCGLTDRSVTSLKQIVGHDMDFGKLNKQVAEYFCKVFDVKPDFMQKDDLYKLLQQIS